MPEFAAALTEKSSLRKMTETLSSDALEKLLHDLDEILGEKRQVEAAKAYLIDEIKALMSNTGMTLGLLTAIVEKEIPRSTRSQLRSPKYEILINGETYQWSGRGRTPKVFAEYMEEQGITKDNLPKAPD